MLVSSFNLSQSFNDTPYLFYIKRSKSEINSFCIWAQFQFSSLLPPSRALSHAGITKGQKKAAVLPWGFSVYTTHRLRLGLVLSSDLSSPCPKIPTNFEAGRMQNTSTFMT